MPDSLGIFGGTFDPIHVAHLAVAEEAAEALGLERILFMPAGQPPHKPGLEITPAEQRLEMVQLAIAGNDRFMVDRREIDRGGPSYTVDTLEDLRAARVAEGASPDLTLVLSAEAFLGLMTWREPRRVMELARVVVAPRDGYPDAGPAFLAEHHAGPRRPGDLPRWAASAPLGERAASPRGGRSIAPLSRPGCGRGVYRRPCSLPALPEGPAIVTEPAMPRLPTDSATAPRADGLPKRAKTAPATERPPLELARRIVELAEDKKAADIVLLDLAGLTTMADYFIICSGGSERQLSAIADGIISSLRDEKTRPIGREGTAASHWVLVDFGSVIVHIFTPPEREYYGLEKHWSEAKTILSVQ